MKVAPEILSLQPYQPGKPISETKREFNLKEVIKLASNESPLPPSQSVQNAIREHLNELHRYPDGACFEMRQAVANYYSVPTNQLVFGNGSDEIVDRLVQIYCAPGDAILTSQGAFIAYQISAQSCRARTIHTPLTKDYRFDLPAMIEALKKDDRIRLVFLPNPNNPTGTYFTQAEFEEFMQVVGQKDVLVVLDEAYVEFVRAKDYAIGKDFYSRYKNILLLRTMSKVFGLASLRIGILIAAPEVCDLVNRVRKPFNVNSLAQVAVVAALQDKEHLKKIQKLTWDGLDYFYDQLNKMGLEYCPSQANFVFFDTGRDAGEVYQQLLKQGVILRPVKNYGFNQHLRMSVGLPKENEAAVAALQSVLKNKA